ncbi:MAG: helix-turn-helix transcriptional regulator [Acutalibacteraceae bacterium]|nr:helix-turn-helix transcriptional regulator [Acutalibacteraceae bacterium]
MAKSNRPGRLRNPYVASNIKCLRKAYNLSQQNIADELIVDRSTYTYYEIGKTEPSIGTITKIISIYRDKFGLDITFNDLLDKDLVKEGIVIKFDSKEKLIEYVQKKRKEITNDSEFYQWLLDWTEKFKIYASGYSAPKTYSDLVLYV